jgi:hypothetical protein
MEKLQNFDEIPVIDFSNEVHIELGGSLGKNRMSYTR